MDSRITLRDLKNKYFWQQTYQFTKQHTIWRRFKNNAIGYDFWIPIFTILNLICHICRARNYKKLYIPKSISGVIWFI